MYPADGLAGAVASPSAPSEVAVLSRTAYSEKDRYKQHAERTLAHDQEPRSVLQAEGELWSKRKEWCMFGGDARLHHDVE